jgi:hypothetical protein
MPILSIGVSLQKLSVIISIVLMLSAGIGGYYVLRADVEKLKQVVSTEGVIQFATMQADINHFKEQIEELKEADKVLHRRITIIKPHP